MKKLAIFVLIIYVISIFTLSGCEKSPVEKKVVLSTGEGMLLETAYGDSDPIKLINTVSLIIKGTVTKAEEPYYLDNFGFPRCGYRINVNTILKGNNIVSVDDEVYMYSLSGYVKFSTYASTIDNSMALQVAFPEGEYNKYLVDDNAYVACHFQDDIIPEEGKEYIFLLTEYDGKNSAANWVLWSARSSVLLITDNKLEGWATSLFGETYDELIKVIDLSLQTPDVKFK